MAQTYFQSAQAPTQACSSENASTGDHLQAQKGVGAGIWRGVDSLAVQTGMEAL